LLGKVLEILNTGNDWSNSIRDILHEIKSFSKFDAVGIRIEKDNDFPYYACEGLSDDFLAEENSLCARLKDGSVRFDEDGQPILECTCGMVISGKVPEESYITRKGSLWTNDSGKFLDVPDIEDPRHNPRNVCIHHGYLSVMLVPLKNGKRTIGLLQMNSRAPGKFTPEDIEFFEELGHTISIAYSRILNETIIINSRVEIARNEESLREAEKISRTLLNASGSINILINAADYAILDINRAGSLLFGPSSEDIRGTNAADLFRRISDVFHEKLNEALRESKTVRFQEENSGKYFYNQIYPIKNESGEIHRLAVFIQDISEIHQIRELRELNNELSELNATKDRLFSVLGHDLRSPVSGILNLAELLDQNLSQYETTKSASFIKSILVTSYQVLNLLDNLTIWAKSRRGQIDFNPVFFRLAGIIPEVTGVMQSAATNKRISIISNIADDVMCYADINMINCILRNLVQNAIKFTNAEGWVKIDSAILPGKIELSVSDNGIGMNDELKQSLFKTNTPVSVQGTSKEKGSGIGLLLCSEFIERHSGAIKVESEPGTGSRFTVTLPLPEKHLRS
jgi:PAS domain S-box-containing protein